MAKSKKSSFKNPLDQISKGFIVLISGLAAIAVIYTIVEAVMFPQPPVEMYPSTLNSHDENYNSYEKRIGVPEDEDPGLTEQDRTRNKDN
jgi:hypothetical protein